MRDHHNIAGTTHIPKGIAFEIDDLRRIQEWADSHHVRMLIKLDHGIDDEEYEEVIALYMDTSASCFLLIWRNTRSVFAQPLVGRPLSYGSVSHLLENVVARQGADEMGNTVTQSNEQQSSPPGTVDAG